MTIRIPKWALAALLVAGGIAAAFFIGRSSGGSDTSTTTAASGSTGSTLTSSTSTTTTAVAAPPCSEAAARNAIKNSALEDDLGQLDVVAPGQPVVSPGATGPGFTVGKLVCRDFTGDGQEEMLVQLVCCTSASPTPWAVFRAENGEWKLAFDRVGLPVTLSIQGDAIVEKVPVYGPKDPSCCPSTFRFGRVSWNGKKFVYASNEGSPKRTIKASTQGVASLGAFDPRSGSPFDASNAFGPPASTTPDNESCRQSWIDLGLVITFANLGGQDPCGDQGRVASIELSGDPAAQAGWKTSESVSVGMSIKQLRSIYPDAQLQSFPGLRNVYVLIEGPSAVGTSGTYPVLAAGVADGKVSSLRMYVGAAGE